MQNKRGIKSRTMKQQAKHTQAAQSVGQVRIIGGELRGRKLPVLQAEGLRPTSDRVRETLFNWLQFELAGARCLDAFAGSGVLGLEALSRGAAEVVFLEKSPKVAAQLEQNVQLLQLKNAQVICGDTLSWLNNGLRLHEASLNEGQEFNILFVDPPFHQGLVQPVLNYILTNKCFNSNQAWLYLEQEVSLDWPELAGWQCVKQKTTAQVRFGLFHFEQS